MASRSPEKCLVFAERSRVPYPCRGPQVAYSIIPRTQESGAVPSNVGTVGLCMLFAGKAAQPEEKFESPRGNWYHLFQHVAATAKWAASDALAR